MTETNCLAVSIASHRGRTRPAPVATRSFLLAFLVCAQVVVAAGVASAHPGGLDANGGHYCRQKGYDSGKCAPLNSYHSHRGGDSTDSGSQSGPTADSSPNVTTPPVTTPPDTTPPGKPQTQHPKVDRATVDLPVSAESGAMIVVYVAGGEVARAGATGSFQNIVFTLPDGQHALEICAIDGAGNKSPCASEAVDTDGTPPPLSGFAMTPGSLSFAPTRFEITSEPEAYVSLSIDGAVTLTGTADRTGRWRAESLVANGQHLVATLLRDKRGNVSEPSEQQLAVAIPAPPAPDLRVISRNGANPVVVEITGVSHGVVELEAHSESSKSVRADLDASGHGTASLDLPDGDHRIVARTVDFQGAKSVDTEMAEFVVDTTPPVLDVVVDREKAQSGMLDLQIVTEPGAAIRVTSAKFKLDESTVAADSAVSLNYKVPTGKAEVVVTATDSFGNETTDRFDVRVSTPLSLLLGALVLLVLMALAGLMVVGGVVLVVRIQGRARSRLGQPAPALIESPVVQTSYTAVHAPDSPDINVPGAIGNQGEAAANQRAPGSTHDTEGESPDPASPTESASTTEGAPPTTAEAHVGETVTLDSIDVSEESETTVHPDPAVRRRSIADYSNSELTAVMEAVVKRNPDIDDQALLDKMTKELGFRRKGRRIVRRLEKIIAKRNAISATAPD